MFVPFYSRGLATARDAWCYNSSSESLNANIKRSMDFYNDQRYQLSKGFIKDVEYDLTQISWTTSVLNLALKNQEITQDKIGEKVISLYRPFFLNR